MAQQGGGWPTLPGCSACLAQGTCRDEHGGPGILTSTQQPGRWGRVHRTSEAEPLQGLSGWDRAPQGGAESLQDPSGWGRVPPGPLWVGQSPHAEPLRWGRVPTGPL